MGLFSCLETLWNGVFSFDFFHKKCQVCSQVWAQLQGCCDQGYDQLKYANGLGLQFEPKDPCIDV